MYTASPFIYNSSCLIDPICSTIETNKCIVDCDVGLLVIDLRFIRSVICPEKQAQWYRYRIRIGLK